MYHTRLVEVSKESRHEITRISFNERSKLFRIHWLEDDISAWLSLYPNLRPHYKEQPGTPSFPGLVWHITRLEWPRNTCLQDLLGQKNIVTWQIWATGNFLVCLYNWLISVYLVFVHCKNWWLVPSQEAKTGHFFVLWYWIDVSPAMLKMLISKNIVDEATIIFCWIAGTSSMSIWRGGD